MSKKENHYYRLPVSTEKGAQLKELIERGRTAMEAASQLAVKLGAARFTTNEVFLVGGIGCLYFTHKPNQRAYDVLRRRKGYFECVPNRGRHAGYNIFQEIMKLPVVKFSELVPIFGEMEQGQSTPAFFLHEEHIYLASQQELTLDGMEAIEKEDFEEIKKRMESK